MDSWMKKYKELLERYERNTYNLKQSTKTVQRQSLQIQLLQLNLRFISTLSIDFVYLGEIN